MNKYNIFYLFVLLICLFAMSLVGFMYADLTLDVKYRTEMSQLKHNLSEMKRQNTILGEQYDILQNQLQTTKEQLEISKERAEVLEQKIIYEKHQRTADITAKDMYIAQIQQSQTPVPTNWDGSYHINTGIIELYTYNIDSLEEGLNVFLHEWGHKVWYEEISPSERKRISQEFESETDFITEYAKMSVEEYFAENYAYTTEVCS